MGQNLKHTSHTHW